MEEFPTTVLIERPLILATIYELSTIVFGSEGLAQLSNGDSRDEFDKLRVRHEVAKASKLLIEIAVVLRNLTDSPSWPIDSIHEIRVKDRPEESFGTLVTNEKNSELSFRETCNKLIHAESISFGMSSIPNKMDYLDGTVTILGKKQKKPWVAKVELSTFIRMAVRQL